MTAAKSFLRVVSDIIRTLPRPEHGAAIVAIDGPSGSGKTTFAGRLAQRLAVGAPAGPGAVPVVHLDDLYPGWDGLDAVVPRLVDGILAPLAVGRDGTYRRWDWATDTDGAPVPVPMTPLVVIEGAGSGALACSPYLSLLVWLDGPPDWRRDRALARDGATYAPHWQRWAAQEREHFARERTRERAHLVLDASPDGERLQIHDNGIGVRDGRHLLS